MKQLAAWLFSGRKAKADVRYRLPLTRLAFSKRWLDRSGGELRFRAVAFLPYRTRSGSLELSVFRVDGVSDQGIWEHVMRYASRHQDMATSWAGLKKKMTNSHSRRIWQNSPVRFRPRESE